MKRVRSINPLVLAVMGWTITLGSFFVGQTFIRKFGWSTPVRIGVYVQIIAAYAFPLFSVVFLTSHYRSSAVSIRRIVMLYAALVLIGANIDFDIVLHFTHQHSLPFRGIRSVWTQATPGHPVMLDWGRVVQAMVACVHFSIETLSTFNDGEVVATAWYAKLAVDIQVMMGLGVTVLTVGHHFSQRTRTAAPVSDLMPDEIVEPPAERLRIVSRDGIAVR